MFLLSSQTVSNMFSMIFIILLMLWVSPRSCRYRHAWAHTQPQSYTLKTLEWNFPLLIIGNHMSPFCGSPAASLPARRQWLKGMGMGGRGGGVHLCRFQIQQRKSAVGLKNLSTSRWPQARAGSPAENREVLVVGNRGKKTQRTGSWILLPLVIKLTPNLA